jgi:hypothetical protein
MKQLKKERTKEKNYNLNYNKKVITSSYNLGDYQGGEIYNGIVADFLGLFVHFWKDKAMRFGHYPGELYYRSENVFHVHIPWPWLQDGRFKLWRITIINSPLLNSDTKKILMSEAFESDDLKFLAFGSLVNTETIFFISRQIMGVRRSMLPGRFVVPLMANWNTESTVFQISGNGIKSLVERLQTTMKRDKTGPMTRELIEVLLDFANVLLTKAKDLKRAGIRKINDQA